MRLHQVERRSKELTVDLSHLAVIVGPPASGAGAGSPASPTRPWAQSRPCAVLNPCVDAFLLSRNERATDCFN
jgi:hypothetical protein